MFAASCLFAVGLGHASASDNQGAAHVEDADIAALVRALGDPAYKNRIDATRRLCAVGPRATEALRRAAKGDEPEVALRAGNLLGAFENLLFSGVELSLRFSKTRVSWREPVDLMVSITNKATYPSRLPFVLSPRKDDGPLSPADQVGRMIDLADWLVVRDASGNRIDLFVEDILADADVTTAVEKRLADSPVGLLPAGDTVHFVLRDFNRGWARYRFLDAGRYTVELDYAPQWEDEQLLVQRVGAVKSPAATIDIGEAAPASVSRTGRELSLALSVQGDTLTAQLTNHMDRVVHVNKNFGRSVPFATADWVANAPPRRHQIPTGDILPSSWQQFDTSLVVAIPAGESAIIASTTWADLRRRFRDAGVDLTKGAWSIQLVYGNLIDRKWQARQAKSWKDDDQVPPGFRKPLPLWIPIASFTSDAVAVPRAD